jgi:uncharacterized protein YndB with AHSA1/START domain
MADVVHDTFVIVRTYPKAPSAVYAAFADPVRKRRWYGGKATEQYENDFQVGGTETSGSRMGDDTPFPGASLVSRSSYLDIVAEVRIVQAQTMSMDGRRFSASLITFEFRAAADGSTELVFTHQAGFFEGSDGPQMRKHGWTVLLDNLAAELA